MIVQFSILPMGETHIANDVQKATKILSDLGMEYQVGPIGTNIQGDWQDIINAIEQCHRSAMSEHDRVVTTITIDDRRSSEHSLQGAVDAVANGGETGRVPTDTPPPQ